MKYVSIRYYLQESFQNLVKNRLMSVASIGIVSCCIMIISASYCLAVNIDFLLSQLKENTGVVVFMDKDISAEDMKRIGDELAAVPDIDEIKFISQEDALNKIVEIYGEGGVQGIDPLALPFSLAYEVKINDIEKQSDIVFEVEKIAGIKNVTYLEKEAEVLIDVSNAINISSIVIIIALSFMAVIIITNTIKLSVHARKNEISIMKLVGATDWFIRWPFIIEGILIGLFGVALPLALTGGAYKAILNFILRNFSNLNIVLKTLPEIFRVLIPFSIAFGVVLGSIGSIFSVRKYLKV